MNLSETRKRILEDEDFVISEVQKVQTLYELKKVIRYNHTRENQEHTESDAEHIFGMYCLVDYFLPLEDPEGKLDRGRIRNMVQYHEIDEIVTGDTLAHVKTEEYKSQESGHAFSVISKLPEVIQKQVHTALTEFHNNATPEAKFVKAIDKVEPVFHLYNETGRATLAYLKVTKDQHDRTKYPYIQDFPFIKRFVDVVSARFEKEGFYHPES